MTRIMTCADVYVSLNALAHTHRVLKLARTCMRLCDFMAFTTSEYLETYTCVLCKDYLLETPRQAPCGERLCSPCWREKRNRYNII